MKRKLKLKSFKVSKSAAKFQSRILLHVDMDWQGVEKIWYFEIMRGSSIEAAGSADDYQTAKSMAIEAIAEIRRHENRTDAQCIADYMALKEQGRNECLN